MKHINKRSNKLENLYKKSLIALFLTGVLYAQTESTILIQAQSDDVSVEEESVGNVSDEVSVDEIENKKVEEGIVADEKSTISATNDDENKTIKNEEETASDDADHLSNKNLKDDFVYSSNGLQYIDLKKAIPDFNFEWYVQFELNGGSPSMLKSKADSITSIDFGRNSKTPEVQKIGSLTGIEIFPSLKTLIVNDNNITSIPLYSISKLEKLIAYSNKLETIDLRGAPNLKWVHLGGNKIQNVYSNNFYLDRLDINNNPLNKVDFSTFPNLRFLNIGFVGLESMDLSKNLKLQELYCYNSNFINLDVSMLPKLRVLDVSVRPEGAQYHNSLTHLEINPSARLDGNPGAIEGWVTNLSGQKLSALAHLENNEGEYFWILPFEKLDTTGKMDFNKMVIPEGWQIDMTNRCLKYGAGNQIDKVAASRPKEMEYKYPVDNYNHFLEVEIVFAYRTSEEVFWDESGKNVLAELNDIPEGDMVNELSAGIPEKPGYVFDYWQDKNTNKKAGFPFLAKEGLSYQYIPCYKAKQYNVVFDKNGGEGTMADLTMTYGVEEVLTDNVFTKSAYTFVGWNTSADGTGTTYTDKEAVKNLTVTDSVTLYAQWKAIDYSITYELDGGKNNASNALTYTVDDAITFVAPSKSGYTFAGWYDAKTGGNEVTSIALGTTGNQTIYAHWIANDYTVKYDVNGGGSIADKNVKFGDTKLLPTPPTKAGYTFVKWICNGKDVDANTKYSDLVNDDTTKDITLQAQWKANDYTIHFDANGATGTMADLAMTYDVEGTLADNAFTKAGYTFVGWDTSSDGTGIAYTNKEVVKNLSKMGSVTLYAQWEVIDYTITYELDGGVNNASNSLIYTVNDAITLEAPTKTGCTFAGWFDAKDGGNQVTNIALGTTGNQTIYAHWIVNDYTVKYNVDGGTATVDKIVKFGDNALLPTPPTKAGYTFVKWTCNGKDVDTDTKYSDLVNDDTTMGITLQAHWEANDYTIHFDANGATGTMADLAMTYDVEGKLAGNAFIKAGYTFVGWNTSADGTGTAFTDKESVKNLSETGSVTLYAQWKVIDYTVTYELDGGINNKLNADTFTINDAITLEAPTKTGYTFVGWFDAKDSGNQVTSIALGTTGNQTIYAHWIVNDYTVKYDVNGGGSIADKNVKFGDTKLLPTPPTKAGYTFVKWTCNGKDVDANTKYSDLVNDDKTKDITLQAQWKANDYTIHFDANGATGTMADLAMTYDVDKALTDNAFTKAGYTFVGWNTSADGTGTTYTDKEAVKNLVDSNSVTLYAQWKVIDYTITYELDGGLNNKLNANTFTINDAITFVAPTKTGYTFAGWFDAKDGGNKVTSIALGTTGNKTIYAHWIVNDYTVKYDVDGGTTIVDKIVGFGDNTLLPTPPTKTGYTFVKWTCNGKDVDADTKYSDLVNDDTSMGITLQAHWKANEYAIHFDANGATGTMADLAMTYDAEGKLTDNAFTKAGYTFVGWNTSADGTGTTYTDKEAVKNLSETGSVTLYAQWKVIDYTITYELDGGLNNKLNTDTFTINDAIAFVAPTKTGYTFVGWFDAKAGGNQVTNIALGTTGNKTIYAHWIVNDYTVKYNVDGGTAIVDKIVKFGDNTLLPTPPTKAGYTFVNWTCNGKDVDADTKYSDLVNDDTSMEITLQAHWKANEYAIHFDANGATGTMADLAMTFDVEKALTGNVFTKAGYTFIGWNTSADGTGTTYTDKEAVKNLSETGSVTLYAQWEASDYTIHFDANGATGTMADLAMTFDVEKALADNAFTKVGYTFIGWNTSADGTGTTYANKDVVKNLSGTGSVTLYAQWKANDYTIHFDANGATGTMADLAMTYDVEKALTDNAFTKNGYAFVGWNTSADGTGTTYTNKDVIKNLVDSNSVTLYAQWKVIDYSITYELDGGKNNVSNALTYTVDDAITFVAPTRTGCTFLGWFDAKTGGNQVTNIALGTTGNKTIYAHWIVNDYTVKYNVDGGTAIVDKIVKFGDNTLLPTPPTKAGYTFVKWTCNGKDVDVNTKYSDLVNDETTMGITLQAHWKVNEYTITYELGGGINNNANSLTYTINDTFTLEAPTKAGSTFLGWFDAKTGGNQVTSIALGTTGNQTLYAHWIDSSYTVKYDVDGGSAIVDKSVEFGDTTLLPTPPTKAGYTFIKWTCNGKDVDANTKYSDLVNDETIMEITLQAHWKLVDYTISYDLNGGVNNKLNAETFTINDGFTLNAPTKAGSIFLGWFDALDGGNQVTSITLGTTGNQTLYAHWIDNSYTVKYDVDGGSTIVDKIVGFGDTTLLPTPPTKAGYTFVKWTCNGKDVDANTKYSDLVNDETTMEITLQAQWIKTIEPVEPAEPMEPAEPNKPQDISLPKEQTTIPLVIKTEEKAIATERININRAETPQSSASSKLTFEKQLYELYLKYSKGESSEIRTRLHKILVKELHCLNDINGKSLVIKTDAEMNSCIKDAKHKTAEAYVVLNPILVTSTIVGSVIAILKKKRYGKRASIVAAISGCIYIGTTTWQFVEFQLVDPMSILYTGVFGITMFIVFRKGNKGK